MRELVLLLALFDAPAAAAPKPKPTPSPAIVPFDLGPVVPEEFEAAPEVAPELPEPPPPLPLPTPIPSPEPTPPPSLLWLAQRAPLSLETQLGALATITGDGGTDFTPTFWLEVNGPLAFGSSHSLGRLLARLGLSSSPGSSTFSLTDLTTYRAAEVGLGLGRVIGATPDYQTTLLAEFSFSSRLKGSADPAPKDRLVRAGGVGIRFDAPGSSASLTALVGFDEASISCAEPIQCQGLHSGLAFTLYGQVPLVSGSLLLTGDATLAAGGETSTVKRRDILRLGLVIDPVQLVKVIRR